MKSVLAYLSFVSICVWFATDHTTVSHVAAMCMLDGAIPLIYSCIVCGGRCEPVSYIYCVIYLYLENSTKQQNMP